MPAEWRDMSKTCSKVGLSASLACSWQLGSGDAAEKGKEKLTLQVYLLVLDPTVAAAPQMKVATTKVDDCNKTCFNLCPDKINLMQLTPLLEKEA